MKLYATVTSERASKGQGGNDYLGIGLTVEIGGERVPFGSLRLEKSNTRQCYVLSFMDSTGQVREIETKGERQKGDREICKCGKAFMPFSQWCACGNMRPE